MDQDRINKDLLLSRIIHSRELTVLEKRYIQASGAMTGDKVFEKTELERLEEPYNG